jgi:hypothetical protein
VKTAVIACLFLTLLPAALLGNTSGQFELTYQGSTLWRFFNHITIQGDRAFCTAKYGLIVFDISDSTSPVPISQMYLPDGYRQNITVNGNYVYIADGTAGLRIIDISNLADLRQIGAYNPTADVMSASIAGNYAFVTLWDQGLKVINISNPTAPVEIGSCDTARLGYDVKITDSLAYVTTWNAGLQVINIANPAAPVLLGSNPVIDWLQGVAISGSYAAVARGGNGVQLFNVSNPGSPTAAGLWNSPGLAHDLAVKDTFIYVADDYYLQVLGMSNPNALQPLASLWLPFNNDLAIRNQCAYVVTQDSLVAVDISKSPEIEVIGKYFAGYTPVGLTLENDFVYVADESTGLQVVNVADVEHMSWVGSIHTYRATDVATAGNYAYIADDAEGLKIIDVSGTRSMQLVGHCGDIPGRTIQIAVKDTVAYLTTSGNKLELVSIAQPSMPYRITGFALPNSCWGVAVSGHYAYVACSHSGLVIVDVANPQSPQLVGSYSGATGAAGVAIVDTLAYVATTNGVMYVINVARPQSPTFVGSRAVSGVLRNVTLSGKYAYVGGETDSLWGIDISNPQAPTVAGGFKTLGQTRDIAVDENHVYVANYFGFLALDNGIPIGFPCGDWDGTNSIDIADAVYLVRYIFGGGPLPVDVKHGDIDCSGDVNIGDAVYMVSYIFGGGPAPCAGCR